MSSSLESKFRAGMPSRSIALQPLFLPPPPNSYVVEVRGWERGARLDPNARRQRLHAPFFSLRWSCSGRAGRILRALAIQSAHPRCNGKTAGSLTLTYNPTGEVAARALRRFVAGAAS